MVSSGFTFYSLCFVVLCFFPFCHFVVFVMSPFPVVSLSLVPRCFFILVTQIGIILGVVIEFFVLEMMTSTFFSIFVKSNILVISIDIRIGLFIITGIGLKPVSPYGHVASVLDLIN